jgi:methylated-DNA-[protein]-cysteine S-methyltransferase
MKYTYMKSPIGLLLLAGDENGLALIGFPAGKMVIEPAADWTEARHTFAEAIRQLNAYFAGELHDFDLPLAPQGTPFQLNVWARLREIPYGQTISYGELATRIGNPKASRAVGMANGRNPLPIVVPCHRVIGSSGKLTGFGGGLPAKQALLALERGAVTIQRALIL